MILKITKQKDYELIDSGAGDKLERYGSYILSRPDPEAIWPKGKSKEIWSKTQLKFTREDNKAKWIADKNIPKSWNIDFGNLQFSIKPTTFKHTGLFPEQFSNWQWMETELRQGFAGQEKIRVLNLFAYTGGATLACARAGAEVCHVDASKTAVAWARENAELSGLESAPIRWIVDDCLKFLKREVNRGQKYDAIIMDPPSFGHGPKDELWKIEEHFQILLKLCKDVLSNDPLFVLINGYTAGYSAIAYQNCLEAMMKDFGGVYEMGELAIEESDRGLLLPAGIFARWSKN